MLMLLLPLSLGSSMFSPLFGSDARTVAEASAAMDEGQLNASDLLKECLARIQALDHKVRAWTAIRPDLAMTTARACDATTRRSPLHGIPIGVKDVIDTHDLPTCYNSPIYHDHQPLDDADIVRYLREAGAIILGKTVTQEFATRGRAGPTRNPRNLAFTPGGSSSGSAAAVAAGMVPLALSSQTAGSIIRPASYCGIVGYKPSHDWISLKGVKRVVPSFDTLGWHARSVEDIMVAMAAIQPRPHLEPGALQQSSPWRIRLCRSPHWELAEKVTRTTLQASARHLRTYADIDLQTLQLPPIFKKLNRAHDIVSDHEAWCYLQWEWRYYREGLSEGVRQKMQRGQAISDAQLAAAHSVIASCRKAIHEHLEPDALILTASAPGAAPLFGSDDLGDSVFSKGWTTLGMPAISLPVTTLAALPVGVQLVAHSGQDALLLRVAHQVAARLDKTSRPAIH